MEIYFILNRIPLPQEEDTRTCRAKVLPDQSAFDKDSTLAYRSPDPPKRISRHATQSINPEPYDFLADIGAAPSGYNVFHQMKISMSMINYLG
ncbi:hypothetical protein CYY_000265 [Polysphondylium violaceum]|uniref:Uncharacterized protein n=1 Tax=Polysphondylium violaceum TaxID=133409 RepID=A0A8J4Q1U3_9MYCE|nr:hypothetical protein CYY_000265 [Polysphondylium violaceum]